MLFLQQDICLDYEARLASIIGNAVTFQFSMAY
jgi:hypothetical protein